MLVERQRDMSIACHSRVVQEVFQRVSSNEGSAGALTAMQQSSEAAAGVLMKAGATACTDVTGFGLMGHLAEMARASRVAVLSLHFHSWERYAS